MGISSASQVVGVVLAALVLAGCSDQEVLLDGERLDIIGNAAAEQINRADPIALPAPVVNASWTHTGGNAQHQLSNPALDRALSLAWSADIGQGNDRKFRISADPVVASGRIYTMDSRSLVLAHDLSGNAIWSADLTPADESSDDASGGGLAVASGTLYVTSAFGILVALDAASGEEQWRQDLDAASTGAPTVSDGVVYVVTRNSVGWAIDAATGRVLWQALGAVSGSGLAGGPAPAIAESLVVFPFSSGQMVAAVQGPGTQVWAASVAGKRAGRAFGKFDDLSGAPVVANNVIYAGNIAGGAAAFSAVTGQPVWRARDGAIGPMWVAGGSVFFVSDLNRLVRLSAETGETVWAIDLPLFTKERIKKRKGTFAHYGPVLAGGRLLVASDTGALSEFDPVTGALITTTQMPAGAARNPVVVGGALYVVTENGQLHAFR